MRTRNILLTCFFIFLLRPDIIWSKYSFVFLNFSNHTLLNLINHFYGNLEKIKSHYNNYALIDTIQSEIREYTNDDFEEAFFILHYKNVLRNRITVLYSNNYFYIPLLEILKQLEMNYNFNPNEKEIMGFFVDVDSTYSFNFAKSIYKDNSKSFAINKDDFILTPYEIYVKPELIIKAFDIHIEINLNDLTVKLNSDKDLPIFSRIQRERNYRYISKEIIKPDFSYQFKRKIFSGLLLDYFISSNFTKNLPAFYNYNFGIGGVFLGGSTELSINGSINERHTSINDYSYKWSYVINKKQISRLSIGTIPYDGLQQTNLQGFSITNEPIEPRKNFNNYIIADQCGPNWTVELYVNNKLADVTKADANGNFYFTIPLTYGTSFIHLKFYSPSGDYLTIKRFFQISTKFLPVGEFNYTINFGKVDYSKDLLGQLLASYGIKDWLTNSIGIEFLKNNSHNEIFIYNELNARLSSSYLLNLMLAPQVFYRFSFNALFYSQASFNLIATKYFKNLFYNPFNINEDLQFDFFTPLEFEDYSLNLSTSIKFQNSSNIKNKLFAFNIGARTEFINPTLSYKMLHAHYNKYLFKQSYFTYGFIIPLRIFDKLFKHLKANLLSIHINHDVTRKKLVQYNFTYSFDFLPESKMEINYNKTINSSSYLQIGLVINSPYVKLWSSMTNNNIYTNLYGAVSYDSDVNNYSFYNRSQIGKASVLCRMFLDKNGNNKFDEDEPLINDANVSLESPCTIEEVNGFIKIRELNPYTTYILKINESINNPFFVPVYKSIAFQTDANSSKIIDIPFYEGKEIYGNIYLLLKNNLKRLLNGIKIILENLDNNFKYSTVTFSDGSFYLQGIKPGRYKIYVDPEQLKMLKCISYPSNIIYYLNYDNISEDINFELRLIREDYNE